jgi:hypothetical protein
MSTRRRRNLFPGVPMPGRNDPDITHAYPGLADELRDEARREPAMLELGDGGRLHVETAPDGSLDRATLHYPGGSGREVADMRKGDTVSVDLGDGEPTQHVVKSATVDLGDGVQREGRVTLTPLHDGLRDESRDLPAATDAEVEQWRAEGGGTAPELSAALTGTPDPVWGGDTAPEGDEAEPVRTWDEWAVLHGHEPDEGHQGFEWRRVIDSTDKPVEVRLGCGCQIVIRSCTPG